MILPLLMTVLGCRLAACADPIITLPNGKIAGRADTVTTGQTKWTIYSYIGIPFAAPPIGYLRFQPPVPPTNWAGVLQCKNNNKHCYQVGTNDKLETEDCLLINVFTKEDTKTQSKRPVLVLFYGGAFIHGAATTTYQKVKHFVRNDIVVVTLNYRVGPFGFLSTGDTVLPGNMGLKDQQLALKWVQRNIHLFGGDPKQVTIIGQSAGGASVSFHLLSPKSAGLFRAAIAMSGSALSTFGYQQHAVQNAYGIVNEIFPNFGNKSSRELLKALQSATAKQIDNTADKYNIFGPVVEPVHEGAFLSRPFHELAQMVPASRVPVLTGITSEEAIGKAADLKALRHAADIFDARPEVMVDSCMNVEEGRRKDAGGKIHSAYTSGKLADDLAAVIRYASDHRYAKPVLRYAQLQSQFTPVYFYVFSYHGVRGNNPVYIKGAGRVGHAEDTLYMYMDPEDASFISNLPKEDLLAAKQYSTLAMNFIKYLNPTPEKDPLFRNLTVPKVTPDKIPYLDIDYPLRIKEGPREPAYSSWVELYKQYAEAPYVCF
ncbi:unnamed protein product [Acanthoscelides obtectus]|uniref:Carboxylic ester hydrolase n=1 Tax=Acanthoscelides obtectus TaxID=200917 RepID=A0A9P0LLM6_ACAOB|nr:unnamed protein product [Acanthoscelides obtectus]CAK1665033.1 hypothetical protein AOBTE_LOCUS24624 [Acanthoscelides obtectus]